MRYIWLGLIIVLLFLAELLLGSQSIDFGSIFNPESFDHAIVFDFRLPRAITAIVVGVALSVSGLVMQTVFQNPMAGPYMLGVSSGASLGVALFMLAGSAASVEILRQLGVAFSAWIGAVAVLLIVMAISTRLKDIMAVLILGMMLSSASAAFVDVLQFFSDDAALKGFVVWAMGSVGGVSTAQIAIMSICVVIGLGLTFYCSKSLDLLLMGENYARTMGVKIIATRTILFIATALLAGSVTAFCGPIAFVGIAAPHIARMIFKRAIHRKMIFDSMAVGAIMMLLCDLIANVPGSDTVLPINTIAALMGIPVVIMVVFKSRSSKIM